MVVRPSSDQALRHSGSRARLPHSPSQGEPWQPRAPARPAPKATESSFSVRHRPLPPAPSIAPGCSGEERREGREPQQPPEARWLPGTRDREDTERGRETTLSPGPGPACSVTSGSPPLLWILLHSGTPPKSPSASGRPGAWAGEQDCSNLPFSFFFFFFFSSGMKHT